MYNTSDHYPVSWSIELIYGSTNELSNNNSNNMVNTVSERKTINWNSVIQVDKYKQNIQKAVSYIDTNINKHQNAKIAIDQLYEDICKAIKTTYKHTCSELPNVKTPQVWWTGELEKIKKEINSQYKVYKNSGDLNNKIKLKKLKTDFRRKQRRNIYLYEKNKCSNIDKLLNSNNPKKFWSLIKAQGKCTVEEFNNEQIKLQNTYNDYFYENINDVKYDQRIIQNVEMTYQNICNKFNTYINNDKVPSELLIDDVTVISIINEMNKSNALGFDGVSMNMLKKMCRYSWTIYLFIDSINHET